MIEKKYLDYEGLALFKQKLDALRLADKNEIVDTFNEVLGDIGDGKLTILVNNTKIDEFMANQQGNTNVNISVPTTLNDLLNAVEFIKNVIKYGQSDVSNLTEEQKESLHNQTAESSGYVSTSQLATTLSGYGNAINYDSVAQKIQLKNGNTILSEFSAADFIKDSMIQDISVTNGTGNNLGQKVLLINFNSDSGVQDIEIPISEFFNPDNYYTKTDIDSVISNNVNDGQIKFKNGNNNQVSSFTANQSGNSDDVVVYSSDEVINLAKYGLSNPTQQQIQNIEQQGSQLISKNDINNLINNAINNLSTVASSGSYNDLSDKPTIPDAQIQSDWNQTNTSAKDYIKNKPNVYSQGDITNNYYNKDQIDDMLSIISDTQIRSLFT